MTKNLICAKSSSIPRQHGDRIVEIGAVELVNRSLTGQTFHCYLCPQRAVPPDAVAVHGLTGAFLADKLLFAAVADEFLAFVGDAPLVAHNGGFDIAFLNAELKRAAKLPKLANKLPQASGGPWPGISGYLCRALRIARVLERAEAGNH
jgi:DNA polymerase-3 subunit epsilon